MATGNITRLEGVWPETHERAVRDSAGVNLETKLGNINSNISQLSQKVTLVDVMAEAAQQDGYMVNTSGTSNTSQYWQRFLLANANYQKVMAHIYTSSSYAAIAFYSTDSIDGSALISQVTASDGTRDISADVPANARLIVVCNRKASLASPTIMAQIPNERWRDNRITQLWDGKGTSVGEKLSDWGFVDGKGISTSGNYADNSKTIACNDLKLVKDYAINGVLYFDYQGQSTNQIWKAVAFYNSAGTFIAPRFGYVYVNSIGVPPNAVYFRLGLGLATSGGTDIGGHKADYDLGNAYIRKSLQKVMNERDAILKMAVPGTKKYIGKRIALENYFGAELYMSLSNSYSAPQGAAAYNGKLFVFHDGNATVEVYDVASKSLVASVIPAEASESYHCNSVSFGTEKYADGDAFPLLYVGMEAVSIHKALVYRVQLSEAVLTLTKVQEIVFPEPSNETIWYPNVAIDTYNGKLFVYGLANTPYSYGKDNTLKFARYPIPKLSAGDVSLNWEDKEDVFTIPNVPTGQGNVILRGMIYQALGFSDNGELHVINPYTHQDESVVELSQNNVGTEPEFVFENAAELYVGYVDRRIYKLSF